MLQDVWSETWSFLFYQQFHPSNNTVFVFVDFQNLSQLFCAASVWIKTISFILKFPFSIVCFDLAWRVGRNSFLKKNFMTPFYGWGSTASRLEPLQGGSLLFTTKFPETGTHFIDLRRMKGWVDHGATQWFWTQDPGTLFCCTTQDWQMSQVEELLPCFSLSTGCLEIMRLDFVGNWLFPQLEIESLQLLQLLPWEYEEIHPSNRCHSSLVVMLRYFLLILFGIPTLYTCGWLQEHFLTRSANLHQYLQENAEFFDDSSHEKPSSTDQQHLQSLCHCLMLYFWHYHILQWSVSVQGWISLSQLSLWFQ